MTSSPPTGSGPSSAPASCPLATLTPAPSLSYNQRTLKTSRTVIFSAALVAGHSPSNSCSGRLTARSGQAPAPVSPSRSPVSAKPPPTPVISGLNSSASSAPPAQPQSSANKSPARMLSERLNQNLARNLQSRLSLSLPSGSIEYRQTWKMRTTPAGRQLLAHTASARLTSGSDCGGERLISGYNTPHSPWEHDSDYSKSTYLDRELNRVLVTGWTSPDGQVMQIGETLKTFQARQQKMKLKHGNGNGMGTPIAMQAQMAGWPGPRATDGTKSIRTQQGSITEMERKGGPQDLDCAAHLVVGYPSPSARDWKNGQSNQHGKNARPLSEVVMLVDGWISPRTPTDGGKQKRTTKGGGLRKLEDQAIVAPWPTVTSPVITNNHQAGNNRFVTRVVRLTSGPTSSSSPVSTESTGALNPKFTRWLMAYPPEWESYAGSVMP